MRLNARGHSPGVFRIAAFLDHTSVGEYNIAVRMNTEDRGNEVF